MSTGLQEDLDSVERGGDSDRAATRRPSTSVNPFIVGSYKRVLYNESFMCKLR
jgi:hypothetical protein